MHELGIAAAFLDAALDAADGRPVREVRVAVGGLTGLAGDSLEFGFGLLAEGTPAAGSRLAVTRIPARTRCAGCGRELELRGLPPGCAGCGSLSVTLTAGEELRVEEVVLAGDPAEVVIVGRDVEEAADGHRHDPESRRRPAHAEDAGTFTAGLWPFD